MTAAIVSSLAQIGRTTSTSDIAGAGLKKCRPQTRSGREVSIASSMTDSVEVFVARIASGFTTAFSSRKTARFTSRSSITDSMTKSQSDRSLRCVVAETRAMMASASSAVRLPFSTCRASDFAIDASMASVGRVASRSDDHGGAGGGRDLGDAAAHDARAEYADFLEAH